MTIPVILTNKQSATLQGFEQQEKNLERQLYKEQAKEMGPSPTAPERKPAFVLAEDNCACLRIGYFFMVEAFTFFQERDIIDPKDMDISQRHNNNDNVNCASEDSAQNS